MPALFAYFKIRNREIIKNCFWNSRRARACERFGKLYSARSVCDSSLLYARIKQKDFNAKLSVYLAVRKRFQDILAPDDYKYFSFRLWKEGVARYTEYSIAKSVATHYKPAKEFAALKDFARRYFA